MMPNNFCNLFAKSTYLRNRFKCLCGTRAGLNFLDFEVSWATTFSKILVEDLIHWILIHSSTDAQSWKKSRLMGVRGNLINWNLIRWIASPSSEHIMRVLLISLLCVFVLVVVSTVDAKKHSHHHRHISRREYLDKRGISSLLKGKKESKTEPKKSTLSKFTGALTGKKEKPKKEKSFKEKVKGKVRKVVFKNLF